MDEWQRYSELHNVSVKAIEAVLTKMTFLRADEFRAGDVFRENKAAVEAVLAGMHARLEGLLAELANTRKEFLKNKAPRITRTIERVDALVTDGGEAVDISRLVTGLTQLDKFQFPDFPSYLADEPQVLALTKPLHL